MIRIIVFLLSLLCLSGCMDAQCIDADDFGFAKFTIAAKQGKKNVFGDIDNQVSKWSNTGYSLTGDPLVVVVKNWSYKDNGNVEGTLSAWCPWYGSSSGASSIGALFDPTIPPFPNALSYMCQGMAVCKWRNPNDMCATARSGDADILNAPCIFTKGVGLYALLTSKGYNPNLTVNNMRDPSGTAIASGGSAIAIHIGDPQNQSSSGYELYDINDNGDQERAGGVVYKDVSPYVNGGLYFKILDKHYGDNSGQYLVVVKSGLDYNVPDPIQVITSLVATYFFGNDAFIGNTNENARSQATAIITSPSSKGLVQTLYTALIQNPYYKNIVRASLSLYIIFTGLYYLSGLLQITRSELIKRVMKVAIVATLLDPNLGWSFFHDYLFVFFIEGVQYLISTIQSAASSGPGSSSVLALMMAPETLVKLVSLLFTTWIGIFYIILYLLIFVFLWSVMFKAAVLYLNCLIMIGMIIILGPVFLCFMLFSMTQSLYENWLKQLISYALQPIILITVLAFMSTFIRHEIYATLGFPVCKINFPDLSDGGMGIKNIFYWWVPSPNPLSGSGFSNNMAVIPVPEAHMELDSNGNQTGKYCGPYECFENRYPQLPFLDPNNPSDMNKKSKFFGGSFAQTESLLLLIVLIYLLSKANMSSETIARAIAETSGNATTLPPASIPYIPYDPPASSSSRGEGGSAGRSDGSTRPSVIKQDPLSIDSASSSKILHNPTSTNTKAIGVAGSEMLSIKSADESSNNTGILAIKDAEPITSSIKFKAGSKDDSFVPYKKPKMDFDKRSIDDINIGTKRDPEHKVTLDFKAEVEKMKNEKGANVFIIDPTSLERPALEPRSPIKLDGAIIKDIGRTESSNNKAALSYNVELFESKITSSPNDLLVVEPLSTVIERPNTSSVKISSSIDGVILSENVIRDNTDSRSTSFKPMSTPIKPSVIFEEIREKAEITSDNPNVFFKSNVSESVTYSLPDDRPQTFSSESLVKAQIEESIITIEDGKGNIATIFENPLLVEHQKPSSKRQQRNAKRTSPNLNVKSRLYDTTKATKSHADAGREERDRINEEKRKNQELAKKFKSSRIGTYNAKKIDVESKFDHETESFKRHSQEGLDRRNKIEAQKAKERELRPKVSKSKKPKSDQ